MPEDAKEEGMTNSNANLKGKVCLVTGTSSGIGKATAWGIAKTGATVVMTGRDKGRTEAAREEVMRRSENEDVHILLADLSSQAQIRELARAYQERFSRLDTLVNNAGTIPRKREVSEDGYEMQWAVNHLGYFLLTYLLLPVLKANAPARIVNVSSMVHSSGRIDFEDLQAEGSYSPTRVYANTKLANVLFTYELARRLEGTGVTANCLHPGVIATQLNRAYMGGGGGGEADAAELEAGARTSVYLAASPEVEEFTGGYFSSGQARRSSQDSYDEELAKRLWAVSAEMVGV